MKFTVDRSKWQRGSHSPMFKDDKLCILGFRCLAAKLTTNHISECFMPADAVRKLISEVREPTKELVVKTAEKIGLEKYIVHSQTGDSRDAQDIAKINDSEHINEKQREAQLIALFKNLGDEVEFI